MSLGDLFKDVRDGSKSVKFPEKLVKVLEQKLQMIAMGQDPGYQDQLVRRTMAKFYGHFMDNTFKRQMKENRKIEELILMFATDATGVLKKEPTLAGDGWKIELNNHIAQFVRILRECLRNVSGVSPELSSRLETYTAKLAPSQTSSDSGYESASTSRDRDRDSWMVLNNNVHDMSLVKIVAKLFKIPEADVQSEVDQIRGICTQKAALTDLKSCLKNIGAGLPFPGNREDFDSDAAWQHWKHQETTQLQQLMLVMIQLNPELAKSAPSQIVPTSAARPGSLYSPSFERPPSLAARTPSISSQRRSMYANLEINTNAVVDELDADDEVPVGIDFTYIPPNPRKFYKRLLEIALLADLQVMLSPEVDDNDEVSLGILSGPHIDLINECALRWRIGHPYRVACFLDLLKGFYERSEVPLECIPEALQTVNKVKADTDFDKWTNQDLDYLASVYSQLYKIFLSNIYHAMEAIPNLKMGEIGPYLEIVDDLQTAGLVDKSDPVVSAQISDISEHVKQSAMRAYQLKLQELQSAPGVNRALPLLLLTDELEKWAKLLDKRFPQPLLGQIDLVSLVVEVQIPYFLSELEGERKRLFESSMNGPTPDVPIQDIFALYRRTKTLLSMYQAFVPEGQSQFDIGQYFEPYVRQWLVNTDNKTSQWVQAAIAADKFEAEGTEGHSSSIVDLFDSLRSPISFLEELEWADPYQEARFFTSLAKTISRAVEQYCRKIEELFMAEMFPRPTDYLQPQKSSAWLEKARQLANQSEKKVEPFNFQPQSCVKLNNVEAARKLLDNMYNQMNADKLAEVLDAHGPPVPEKVEKQKFLFTVKVVLAEGLVPTDSSPSSKLDSFITLSDEAGTRVAKTRTIYETNAPRWEESFDISVEKALWLMVSVRDRALIGKHDTVGRAYLCLDPKRFGDLMTHDLWMDLDTQGRVLIRISMEGEKDDVQFFFGRAFRSLKRSESDMVRIFIDKMTPFIRQNLSRAVLKTLIKATSLGIDVNKALGNVTALYRSALSSSSNEVQIPLPTDEKPRIRPEDLTDVEIEQAISPLFDYFDANLQILNTYLSELMKEKVMTKTWKEILITIEGLLVPPLGTVECDMKPLADKEVDIVLKWLKFLRDYFFAGGEGLPLETLHNKKHEDIVSVRYYYDWHTDALMEECVRKMQETLRASPTMKRFKSVYQHKNLGTIKERKKEKKEEKENNGGEVIMRILRMRPGTSDFISQQLQIMDAMKKEQEARAAELAKKRLTRPSQRRKQAPPPVPPVPPLPEEGLR